MKAFLSYQRGLSLVELMVAMAAGLVLMLGATGILVSNQESFRSTENIADIQKGARLAVEMLEQEIRGVGGNACGSLPVVSTVNQGIASAGLYWNTPIRGYDGSQAATLIGGNPARRVAGTDAILLTSGGDTALGIYGHNPKSAQFKVTSSNHGLTDGAIVMACGKENAAVFQITNIQDSNTTVVHNTGTGTPGNCTKGLGYADPPCAPGAKDVFVNFDGGTLVTTNSAFWYIGNNDRGGRSLYRQNLTVSPAVDIEMVDNVFDLQLSYLRRNRVTNALEAASVTAMASDDDWRLTSDTPVVAVEINLTLCGPTTLRDAAANTVCPDGTIERNVASFVQIRSREIL